MAIPLTEVERTMLQAAGTDMYELPAEKTAWKRIFGRNIYYLASHCGNLRIGDDDTTSCAVYGTSSFPKACAGFVMGGYGCIGTQLSRVRSGEDTLGTSSR